MLPLVGQKSVFRRQSKERGDLGSDISLDSLCMLETQREPKMNGIGLGEDFRDGAANEV